jgi:hypothetical protein
MHGAELGERFENQQIERTLQGVFGHFAFTLDIDGKKSIRILP